MDTQRPPVAAGLDAAMATVSRAPQRRARPSTGSPRSSRPATTVVLLVEDNDVNADMLSRRLQRRGFTVLLAEDGLTAIQGAARHRPDLILMDISLPDIDGLEVTRRLKADPATAPIPVIALTAHATVSDREEAFAAGCQEFETKPIDFERLMAKMRAFIVVGAPA
jgi:CheY-like chemotaxis protein